MPTNYRFELTPLTPLHIGTGEGLEPFEYVVTDRFYRFSLDDFMLALPEKERPEFLAAVEAGFSAIRAFVTGRAGLAVGIALYNAGVSAAARDLYDRRMAGGEAHPEIAPFIKSETRPYIPGSSLKGALRTALLYDAMDKDNPARDARLLEREVFRFQKVQEDPFRAFKVGDGTPLAQGLGLRAAAVHTPRQGRWKEDVSMLIETVAGQVSDGLEQTSSHLATFDDAFYRYHQKAFRLTPGRVIAASRAFYGAHLAAERDYTAELPQTAAIYGALAAHAQAMPAHACLVRLAWGSGKEATTVSYALRDAEHPLSRRLADDGAPLGWAELAAYDVAGNPAPPEAGEEAPPAAPRPRPERGRPRSINDLEVGMELEGTVRNIAEFGAFVDVGVGRDGLIHISALAEGRRVRSVEDVVRVGDQVRVKVIEVDLGRRRIGLRLVQKL